MDLTPPQIAVIDNDEDTLNLYTEVIQMNGYIVIGFENPYSLIDYISEHPKHLKFIIIDLPLRQLIELVDKYMHTQAII
ncbi:MAG TPA: hypothetical protein VFK40_12470 [Nitrososphaeraceae archaeon]|nr:hypothetical protein [Nitrososphaeraceae archaeon]